MDDVTDKKNKKKKVELKINTHDVSDQKRKKKKLKDSRLLEELTSSEEEVPERNEEEVARQEEEVVREEVSEGMEVDEDDQEHEEGGDLNFVGTSGSDEEKQKELSEESELGSSSLTPLLPTAHAQTNSKGGAEGVHRQLPAWITDPQVVETDISNCSRLGLGGGGCRTLVCVI